MDKANIQNVRIISFKLICQYTNKQYMLVKFNLIFCEKARFKTVKCK